MFKVILNSLSYVLLLVATPVLLASETHQFSARLNAGLNADSAANPEDVALQQQAEFLETDRNMRLHLEELRAIEGAYGHGLAEAHEQYGQFLLEQELHNAAANEFKQSWHIKRINFGLYSEEQLVPLTQLISALSRQERWEEVHDYHQLSFLIGSRLYPPDDLRYVAAAELYTAWQWDALTNNRLPNSAFGIIESAQQLSDFYESVIERVEQASAGPSLNALNLIVGKARTDMAIAQSVIQFSFNGDLSNPQCRRDLYHAQRRTLACQTPRPMGFARDMMFQPVSMPMAGLYIKRVDDAIQRLDRLLASEPGMSSLERVWIEDLKQALEVESSALLVASRLR